MIRVLSLAAVLAVAACTSVSSPPRSEDVTVDEGKDDGIAATQVAAKLRPLLAFLNDDKNLLSNLGPTDTVTTNLKKKLKVVSYGEFGKAVDLATHAIARNYQVSVGTGYRRAYGLVDL